MFLSYVFSIWLILVLFMSFYKLKWGIVLFLAYMVLVPEVRFQIGGFRLGQNLFTTAFLLSFILYATRNRMRLHWQPLIPFLIFFGVWLVMMPFQPIPAGWMLNMWRVNAMGMLILPFVMYNVMVDDPTSIRLFRNTMLVCIVIAIGYGLVLTRMEGENPYQSLCSLVFTSDKPGQDMESYYAAEGGGRLFGRISSVYRHPMGFALFIGLSLIYIYALRKNFRRWIFLLLFVLIVVMAIACGVRSVLGGLVVALAFYLLVRRSFKLLIAVCAIYFIGTIVFEQMPEVANYVGSIADIHNKQQAVSGSSIDMRLEQLQGALKEASRSPIWGLGYNWTGYYKSIHGDHPVCLAFESLIYVAVCNGALVGCLLWIYLIIAVMVNNVRLTNNSALLNTALVFWIAYACITGEYGYMKTFLIFYVLMLGEQLLLAREEEQEDNATAETSAPPSQLIDKPEKI